MWPRASRTTCRCTRDPLMLYVLLQRCGLGTRINLADVICTACHSRRRWHSLARTALAKHAAISCRQVVRHPPGGKSARPRRRRVTCTSRGDFWTAPPVRRPACHVAARWSAGKCGEQHSRVRVCDVVRPVVPSCTQAVRISFLYRVKKSKSDRTTSVELIYGLRFFALAAKCCM